MSFLLYCKAEIVQCRIQCFFCFVAVNILAFVRLNLLSIFCELRSSAERSLAGFHWRVSSSFAFLLLIVF